MLVNDSTFPPKEEGLLDRDELMPSKEARKERYALAYMVRSGKVRKPGTPFTTPLVRTNKQKGEKQRLASPK